MTAVIQIVGFGLVLYSLGQMNLALTAEVYSRTDDHCNTLNQAFIEHPELRPYFYNSKDLPAGWEQLDPTSVEYTKYSRVASVAEMTIDVFDTICLEQDVFGSHWPKRQAWNSWMIDSFATSPVLCRALEQTHSWYDDPKLMDLMKKGRERAAQKKLALKR